MLLYEIGKEIDFKFRLTIDREWLREIDRLALGKKYKEDFILVDVSRTIIFYGY